MTDPLKALIQEIRALAVVAGHCSVEGPQGTIASMAAAEAERCLHWADRLDQIAGATPAQAPTTFDADDVRLTFQGTGIDAQRMRIVTASLSQFCADHICIYHTGGDNSVEDLLLTNSEGRYLLEVLTQIFLPPCERQETP